MKTGEGDKAVSSVVGNFRRGHKSFTHMKWWAAFASSGLNMSVAAGGLLGVAGLSLSLIKHHKFTALPWFSTKKVNPLEKVYFVPGLRNLGNNCFLNVILQSLAGCSSFQPYLKRVIAECESSGMLEWSEGLQLTLALADLLEGLCAHGEQRVVLSPRNVMVAMRHHIPNFNLMNQQDAEEAFLHLLSSLRDEFSDCYGRNYCSVAGAFASYNCRIITSERKLQNEQERWQQHFFGPFNGILCSALTCKSCSTQISLGFQSFHSLPLLPVLHGGAIMAGCTLEDCLNQLVIAEQVEDYHCSHCWHNAAVKFLSLSGAKEAELEQIKRCTQQDSCTCHGLGSVPWSNKFSYTLKQLRIAHAPKILCTHLQRVSANHIGELVKLQGHIDFPLFLNLRPFMLEELQCQGQGPRPNKFNMQSESKMLNLKYGQNILSNISLSDGSRENVESDVGEPNLAQTEGCSEKVSLDKSLQTDEKDGAACQVVPLKPIVYRLVSVVEHFGRAGGGHYTVYRSLRADENLHPEDPDENFKLPLWHWYSISDSEVRSVSEEDVLAADASLLFYERIIED